MKTPMSLRGKLLTNVPLVDYTSWRVGGVADKLYKPADLEDCVNFFKTQVVDEPVTWLGLGSNILVRDGGVRGTVLVTQGCLNRLTVISEQDVHLYTQQPQILKDEKYINKVFQHLGRRASVGTCFVSTDIHDQEYTEAEHGQRLKDAVYIRAEAGVACPTLARFAARLGLEGAEFLAGIPGTVGGALRMNAGCHRAETWDIVASVETINQQGEKNRRYPDDYQIGYRSVTSETQEWFVAGVFRLRVGKKESSLETIRTLLNYRNATQPTDEANCGSVFRNPPGDYAARLIETCGLKGKRVGDASVSTKHANFIINTGHASATDIEELMQLLSDEVMSQYRIGLVPEVKIIGER